MGIFKSYFDYLDYKTREWEEFIVYFLLTEEESTDMDCTNNYELSEYTIEVGDDDLPF